MSPSEHYAEADRLLAEVAGKEPIAPIVQAKVALAAAHAALAQCHSWIVDDEYDGCYPVVETRYATGDRL
ncbi:hypothetical protein MPUL_53710 [Mycolicibacterium pulveris]|uniref:Uncharacterized protein n=2 Tax=Mycolicibacterium pulveris TaxID=36813 RepID=A0A7I7UTM9_MYCPV|nr:hypothetical protein MPUL_53710 [Mycolicibacterium pulveris]